MKVKDSKFTQTDDNIRMRILHKVGKSSATAFVVYHTLCSYAYGDKDTCFPSVESIMKDTGLSNKTISVALRDLERVGVLEVDRQRGKHNNYKLVTPKREFKLVCGAVSPNKTMTGPKRGNRPVVVNKRPAPVVVETPVNNRLRDAHDEFIKDRDRAFANKIWASLGDIL